MSLTDEYTRAVLKKVVAQICLTIGWHSIHTTPLEVMVDVLHRFIAKMSRRAVNYSHEFGSASVTLNTLGLAFRDMGIKVEDLAEYIQNVESVPLVDQIPIYPISAESHLNFLKPGSREVVTRPVHVHEHLPPMYPEMEEEDSQQVPLSVDTASTSTTGNSPLSSPKGGNIFKRPGEPASVEHPAVKRARQMLEEEGRPLREISSVMMTTSGFLSPAREGKLPESRTPVLSDPSSYSPASSPSSYPMVPPEVKGDKKTKKVPPRKLGDGVKKLEEKEFKKVDKLKDVLKVDKNNTGDEPKVKKLAGMKEFAKLKALKSGALKNMMAQSSAGALPSTSGMAKIPKIGAPKIPLIKPLKSNKSSVKIPKIEKPIIPNLPIQQQKSINVVEKVKDFGMVAGKLSSEPDKQKLNIFKKISKVKEEKSEEVSARDNSPGCEARMAQIDNCIDSVIQRSLEADLVVVTVSDSDSRDSDTMSALPKTPDLPDKKRKRERSKSRKEKGRSPKSSPVSSPKKIKLESAEPEPTMIPKFLDPSELRPSGFPFFTHYPPAPGLIPPPISHPLFPRFPLSLGKNMPHFAMPNLAMPPALFMHHREEPPEKPPPRPPTPTIAITPPAPEKSSSPAPLSPHPKEKVSTEKKGKDHKREKKDKDKTKRKKDKKERLKAKAEKRKIKEEKKERDKEKLILKKEKKEKRKEKEKEKEKVKEKEREEKSEGAVPKITFRLGPSSPRPPTPDVLPRKIPNSKKDGGKESTIKPVVKKVPEPETPEFPETSVKREPSPELARISALITRPPKKSSSKGVSLPCPDLCSPSPSPPMSSPPFSLVPLDSAKKSIGKPYAKMKPKSLSPNVARGDIKESMAAFYHDKEGNKVWICPACGGQDDGSPMIGCDDCDAWYHWVCVGIQVPPDENEDWYCRVCIVKKQENYAEKNKKKRKKKQQSPN